MTDWREAGRKADAHRTRDLLRQAFDGSPKSVARARVVAALKAAGAETVLDLWGGGGSAKALTEAGFRVISVDDGSFVLEDHGRNVRAARRQRALERTAAEDGYEARWGKAEKFAHEADSAFLDFCGPWTRDTRRTVMACRHMKAVLVTLVTGRAEQTEATTLTERIEANRVFLKLAWQGTVRTYLKYRRPGGNYVLVFYLYHGDKPRYGPITDAQRAAIDPVYRARRNETRRVHHATIRKDPAIRERQNAESRAYYAARRHDPEFRERQRAYTRDWRAKHPRYPGPEEKAKASEYMKAWHAQRARTETPEEKEKRLVLRRESSRRAYRKRTAKKAANGGQSDVLEQAG